MNTTSDHDADIRYNSGFSLDLYYLVGSLSEVTIHRLCKVIRTIMLQPNPEHEVIHLRLLTEGRDGNRMERDIARFVRHACNGTAEVKCIPFDLSLFRGPLSYQNCDFYTLNYEDEIEAIVYVFFSEDES